MSRKHKKNSMKKLTQEEAEVLLQKYTLKTYENFSTQMKEIRAALKSGLPRSSFVSIVLENAIENNAPLRKIKALFEYDVEHNRKNPDIYKWACCFCDVKTVEYFEDKLEHKNLSESVTGAVAHYKLDTLRYLVEKKNATLMEGHFSNAISWSYRLQKTFILDVFMENLHKIPDLSEFSIKQIKDSWLINNLWDTSYGENMISKIENVLFHNKLQNDLANNSNSNTKKPKI